jgi:hypothetical protein
MRQPYLRDFAIGIDISLLVDWSKLVAMSHKPVIFSIVRPEASIHHFHHV